MRKQKRFEKYKLNKGIYILPNIFTSLNLFCGFYAIIASIEKKYSIAAVSVVIAIMFDILDGKIARATKTTSKFGVEYDSLADLVTFGVAPGLMMYLWALKPYGRLGWLTAFLFMACGALRLARFNTQAGSVSSDSFVGLPIPAGAGMNAVTLLLFSRFDIGGETNPVLILCMLYVLSFLMVSPIRYNSFKKPELFRRINFHMLVTALLVLIFIAAQPSIALFLLGLAYVISGPATLLYYRSMKRKKSEISETDERGSDTV
ncbi:MAG: CDP-diacylglycerol--serine O-phosphatidyltransferase [Desulfobacteraceae bacterium]|nr:MAG: CDP-diacylglycerol--serine O-phosphatidyltransferase [Desulfobacteraceae bacterium]